MRASPRSLRLLSGAIPAGVGDRWRSGAARITWPPWGLKKETKIESRTAVRTGFTGRAAIGYDHGYDAEVFYDPEGEEILRGEWEEGEREMVLDVLKAECEVKIGKPPRY